MGEARGRPRPSGAEAAWESLVRRAQAGERAAWDDLWLRLEPLVGAWVRKLLPPNQVEDAVQEVLLAVWSVLPRFKWQSGFVTWLYAVAERQCRQIRRREAKRRRTLDRFAAAARGIRPVPATEGAQEVDQRDEVWFALSQLSQEDRRLLALKYFMDNDYRSLAAWLGVPDNVVRLRCLRARERMRKRLEEQRSADGASKRHSAPPGT